MRVLALFLMAALSLRAETPSLFQQDSEGWENLLADSALGQWQRVPPSPDPKYALGEKSPWSFDPATGILRCDCAGLYELFLNKETRVDGTFHVEWRFAGPSEKPDSGILVRASDDASTWLQAQIAVPGLGTMSSKVRPGDLDKKVSGAGQRRPDLLRPAGEWNVMEVTCRQGRVTLWFNGENLATVENYGIPSGRIGLQAEYTPMEFRNLLFKP